MPPLTYDETEVLRLRAALDRLHEMLRPVTMSDVRLRAGEGALRHVDILVAVNAHIRPIRELALSASGTDTPVPKEA